MPDPEPLSTRHAVWLGLRSVVFTVLVPGAVTVYVPYRILLAEGRLREVAAGPLALVALLLIACGAAVYLRCVWDFAATGRGTPAIYDPPRRFVAVGLYRWVRNPMYGGVESMVQGEALLFRSGTLAIYGLGLFAAFTLVVLLLEEPALRGKFGETYEDYRRRVPRFFPRPPRPGPPDAQ